LSKSTVSLEPSELATVPGRFEVQHARAGEKRAVAVDFASTWPSMVGAGLGAAVRLFARSGALPAGVV